MNLLLKADIIWKGLKEVGKKQAVPVYTILV